MLLVATARNHPCVAPEAIVAILARDEARSIERCLSALAHQVGLEDKSLDGRAFGVVLFLNNCRDATAEIARNLSWRFPYPLRILSIELPAEQAHAGGHAAAPWMPLATGW